MEAVDAILLTGTGGVGKSAVLMEIGEALDAGDAPYALVDLDWLSWVRPADDAPFSVQQILVENLSHACRTFRRAGVRRFVMARAITATSDVEGIRSALGSSARLCVVHLTAASEVVAKRLRGRDHGGHLAEHLEQADAFAIAIERAQLDACVVATDDRDAASVAQEVLVAAAWYS